MTGRARLEGGGGIKMHQGIRFQLRETSTIAVPVVYMRLFATILSIAFEGITPIRQ